MAQLPASMRRKRAAITSIHDKPPTRKDKLTNFGGWLLMLVAIVVLAVGVYGLYTVMTDAHIKKKKKIGTPTEEEKLQVIQHVVQTVKTIFFLKKKKKIRDQSLELSWVDRVVVSRAWPNSIRVRVMPRHAIARWGTGRLLSDSGDIFAGSHH